MSLDQLSSAISAHGQWKSKLKLAIEQGGSALDISTARRTDACEFGKWLASADVTSAFRSSPRFQEAVKLHAQFHQCTAQVLTHLAAGRKADALASIATGGQFATSSADLTLCMMAWKREMGAAVKV